MNAFESSIQVGMSVATSVMGEDFSFSGKTIKGIFDKLEMSVSREVYGSREEATAKISFPIDGFPDKPRQGLQLTRNCSKERFRVLWFDPSEGNYDLMVKRIGKQSRGE